MFKRILTTIRTIIGRRKKQVVKLPPKLRCYECVPDLPMLPRASMTALPSSADLPKRRLENQYFRRGLRVEKWDASSELFIGFILDFEDSIIQLN